MNDPRCDAAMTTSRSRGPGFILVLLLLAAPSRAAAQSMPLLVDPLGGDGPYEVWVLDEATGQLEPGPTSVAFQSLSLAGRPPAERLRLDRPALVAGDEQAPTRVRLPGGGALYRVMLEGGPALLHVDAQGRVDVPVWIAGESEALAETLHVSTDGRLALVATSGAAGGDVLLVDLAEGQPARSLTLALPPLAVEPSSLRVAPQTAWFVAGGTLYRADLAGDATAHAVELGLPGLPVHPELAAAAHSGAVAAVLGSDPAQRHLVSVSAAGEVSQLTAAPAAVQLPMYDHPLGPRLAVSPDGALVAWLQLEGNSLELYTAEPQVGPAGLHLTSAPAFPAYLDNVAVLGFQFDRLLLFLTGDTTLSGLPDLNTIGAGEMFAADMLVPTAPAFLNVSQSGGGYDPPYTEPAGLWLTELVFDPVAQHCVISGGAGMALASFAVYPLLPGQGVATHLVDADDPPTVEGLGERLLVASQPQEVEETSGPPAPEIDLDLGLLALSGDAAAGLSSLLAVPSEIDVDRLVGDRDGLWTAFVAALDDGVALTVLLSADDGLVQLPTWPHLVGASGPLAFSSSGRLYFAVGAEKGPTKFVAVHPGHPPQLVSAPKGRGFPLAH